MRMKSYGMVVLAAITLTACSGGSSSSGGGGCIGSFAGASTPEYDNTQCPACEIRRTRDSVDGSRDTFTELVFDSTGTGIVARATAQSGVVFPSGNRAGAIMRFPRRQQGGFSPIGVTVMTYLGGEMQEQVSANTTGVGNIDGAGEDRFYGGSTSMMFDAVELDIDLGGGDNDAVRIYEFCGQ